MATEIDFLYENSELKREVRRLEYKLTIARDALVSIAGWSNHADPRAIEDCARKALKDISDQ